MAAVEQRQPLPQVTGLFASKSRRITWNDSLDITIPLEKHTH
jgi:hypothetical protein